MGASEVADLRAARTRCAQRLLPRGSRARVGPEAGGTREHQGQRTTHLWIASKKCHVFGPRLPPLRAILIAKSSFERVT